MSVGLRGETFESAEAFVELTAYGDDEPFQRVALPDAVLTALSSA
jgi:hypothetical protein